jgi:predicted nucleic acid-binding protein
MYLVDIDFISDTIEDSGVMRICLSSDDLKQVIQVRQIYPLDFDDCYQYIAAKNIKADEVKYTNIQS